MLVLAAIALRTCVRYQIGTDDSARSPLGEAVAYVERVVDGDTIRLTNGETVRLIGIDAPELGTAWQPEEPLADEATAYLQTLVAQAGHKVGLTFDGPRRDKYGRLLAYVWAAEKLVNEEMIRAGLARAELGYPYSTVMKDRFERAENEARLARRGIWASVAHSRSQFHQTP